MVRSSAAPFPSLTLLLTAGLLVSALAACKTTPEATSPSASAPTAAPEIAGGSLDPALDLPKADEQALYLTMLGVELEAGVKVAKDQLHSSRGVLECRKDGVVQACSVRVRLGERELSSSQPTTPALGKQMWEFIQSARAELVEAGVVLTDVICDYIGKKSPPYGVEDVNCTARQPRRVSEAVFGEPVADELTEALRGGTAFGDRVLALHGAISCNVVEGSQRTPCVVRATSAGVLADQVVELSAKTAAPVARRLLQAVLDQALLQEKSSNPLKKPLVAPKELVGNLVCIVDSTAYANTGARHSICRASI